MVEYIERDRLYELGYWHGATPTPDNPFPDGIDAVDTKDIDSVPAADVVPVVRCKDCRHVHTGKDVYYCRYWERWGLMPNGFCSSGAKMDGEA